MKEMGIGTNVNQADAGEIKGVQEAIACGVWFTSCGRVLPKTVKFEDDDGIYQTLQHIHVISENKTLYCGIPTVEFECNAVYQAQDVEFRLLFYQAECAWKLLWKNKKISSKT